MYNKDENHVYHNGEDTNGHVSGVRSDLVLSRIRGRTIDIVSIPHSQPSGSTKAYNLTPTKKLEQCGVFNSVRQYANTPLDTVLSIMI